MSRTIAIGGVAVALKYTLLALCRMEEEHKVNVFSAKTWEPSPNLMLVLIWGGCLEQLPDLTVKKLMAVIDLKQLPDLHNKAVQQLNDDLPDTKEVTSAPSAQPTATP